MRSIIGDLRDRRWLQIIAVLMDDAAGLTDAASAMDVVTVHLENVRMSGVLRLVQLVV